MTHYLARPAALVLALLPLSAAAQGWTSAPRAEIAVTEPAVEAPPAQPEPGQPGPDRAEPGPAPAAEAPAPAEAGFAPLSAEGLTIEQFRWEKRLVIVLADSPDNPAFADQLRMLAERPEELAQRDAVVIVDANPEAASAIRRQLRPRGFMLVLMDKDGQIAQRKPFPWTVREITRAIDKMPLRQEELRAQRMAP
jgi:hypothetical protein